MTHDPNTLQSISSSPRIPPGRNRRQHHLTRQSHQCSQKDVPCVPKKELQSPNSCGPIHNFLSVQEMKSVVHGDIIPDSMVMQSKSPPALMSQQQVHQFGWLMSKSKGCEDQQKDIVS